MFPLVRLSDVSVNVGGAVVLSGVNWSLRAGEVWAVTGPNGAGKSTLLRVVAGEAWHAGGERVFALGERETRSPLGARERVALVSPELSDWYLRHDWSVTGLQVIVGGVTGARLPPFPPRPEHEVASRAAAARAGVTELLDTDVRSLSQGQRRRVLLARALASAPRVLVLDEVWEGVDAASTAHLRAVVAQEIAGGLTVVYSTHRTEEFLEGTTGHLRVEGGSAFEVPMVPAERPSAMRAPVSVPPAGRELLRVEHADVYREGTHAVRGLNWSWREGQHWALLGPNGAGKSSVARLVAGELFPAVGGRVVRAGLSERATLEERRQHVGLVSAETQAQLLRAAAMRDRVTGEVVVASGFGGTVALAGPLTDAQRERLLRVTDALGARGLLDRDVEGLSHGQLKRLLLARTFVHTPPLLVLDEPYDYLDAQARAGLDGLIAEAVAGGAHLLLIAHRPGDLPGVITHALVMQAGEAVYAGPLAGWVTD